MNSTQLSSILARHTALFNAVTSLNKLEAISHLTKEEREAVQSLNTKLIESNREVNSYANEALRFIHKSPIMFTVAAYFVIGESQGKQYQYTFNYLVKVMQTSERASEISKYL